MHAHKCRPYMHGLSACAPWVASCNSLRLMVRLHCVCVHVYVNTHLRLFLSIYTSECAECVPGVNQSALILALGLPHKQVLLAHMHIFTDACSDLIDAHIHAYTQMLLPEILCRLQHVHVRAGSFMHICIHTRTHSHRHRHVHPRPHARTQACYPRHPDHSAHSLSSVLDCAASPSQTTHTSPMPMSSISPGAHACTPWISATVST